MKLFLFSLVLVANNTFATQKITVETSKIAEYFCKNVIHAFNVPVCKKEFEHCVNHTLSLRIMIHTDQGVRYFWALNQCVNDSKY